MSRETSTSEFETIDELLHQLGGISPKRVRLKPTPGKATERDLIRLNDRHDRLYELVDGTLVEKPVGYAEAFLALEIGFHLRLYLTTNDLGILVGSDGPHRLLAGLVRLPDVSFIRWERLPVRGQVPTDAIAGLAPDLAVEVLSRSNTRGEMRRKLREYFLAGVLLVWYVDPRKRLVQVYTAPDQFETLTEQQLLSGGNLLPGLTIPLRQLFARLPQSPPRRKKRGTGKS